MADERVIQRALTYEQDAALDGNVLVLRRMVKTREASAFQWLSDPAKLALWSPCVPDRHLDATGPVTLRENPDDDPIASEVTVVKAPHRLTFTWGGDELDWTVAGTGIVPAASPSCLLTLRQTLSDRAQAGMMAAGWHLCISTLDLRVSGIPADRVVGQDALAHGWQDLRERFDAKLGLT